MHFHKENMDFINLGFLPDAGDFWTLTGIFLPGMDQVLYNILILFNQF